VTEKFPLRRWLMAFPIRLRPPGVWQGGLVRALPVLLAAILVAVGLDKLGILNARGFGTAVALFIAFLCLVYLAYMARGRFRDGLIVVSALVLGLAALDALAVKTATTSVPVVGKGFYAPRPEIGWGAAGPGAYPARKTDPQTGSVIYDVTYTIDGSLLRETRSADTGPTIAFFGDSFTFGEGVNDGQTMPQAFADLTDHRLRVLNFGFSGYGPGQVLRALETGIFDALLTSEVRLIVVMTAPWHAERTACKPTFTLHGPRYRLHGDSLEYLGACSEGLTLALREWFQNTALYRTAIEPYLQRIDHDDVELYIRVVLAIVDLAKRKHGVATLVPYLPVGDEYLRGSGFTDASIVERFRAGGASVIDVSLAKERAAGALLEIPGDGHPTASAHAARAQSIKAFVAAEMPDLLAR
jgi:hypothetical protein